MGMTSEVLQLGLFCWICEATQTPLPCTWCGLPACAAHRADDAGNLGCVVCTAPAGLRGPVWPMPAVRALYVDRGDPYCAAYAVECIDRSWQREEIGPAAALVLAADVRAGRYPQSWPFYEELMRLRDLHLAATGAALGDYEPCRRRADRLGHADVYGTADHLRMVIYNMHAALAGTMPCAITESWKRRKWEERLQLLRCRHRWLTGEEQ